MNFTEEARAVYMNHCLHGSTEPEFIQAIAAALQSAYESGEQSGREKEREHAVKALEDRLSENRGELAEACYRNAIRVIRGKL